MRRRLLVAYPHMYRYNEHICLIQPPMADAESGQPTGGGDDRVKYRSFTIEQKLKVIERAEKSTKRGAASEFNVSQGNVQRWCQMSVG